MNHGSSSFVEHCKRFFGYVRDTVKVWSIRYRIKEIMTIFAIGFGLFLVFGWAFSLLQSRSYVLYGVNALFMITFLIMRYASFVNEANHQDDLANHKRRVMIATLKTMDGIVFTAYLVFVYVAPLTLSPIESIIFFIVSMSYLVFSWKTKKTLDYFFTAVFAGVVYAFFAIILENTPMVIQHTLSVIGTLAYLFYAKKAYKVTLTPRIRRVLTFLVFASGVLYIIGYEPNMMGTVDFKQDMSFDSIDETSFQDAIDAIVDEHHVYVLKETDHQITLEIYDHQLDLLKTHGFSQHDIVGAVLTLIDQQVYVDHQISSDTIRRYQVDSDLGLGEGERLVTDINFDGGVISYRGMDAFSYDQGYVLFGDQGYWPFWIDDDRTASVWKETDMGYELLFVLDDPINSNLYHIRKTKEGFLLSLDVNEAPYLIYLDDDGNLISTYGERDALFQGLSFNQTESSLSTKDPLLFYLANDQGDEMVVMDGTLYEVQRFSYENMVIPFVMTDRRETVILFGLFLLVVPFVIVEKKRWVDMSEG